MVPSDDKVIRECEVLSVEDDKGGLRIKVRIAPDDADCKTIEELPWCYPLLPKHLHINPKVGEMVLVLVSTLGVTKNRRWFIGPVVSQSYYLDYDPYKYSSRSLLDQGKVVKPLPNPSLNPNNEGSTPNREDVAIQGRGNADVVLKENEAQIRCGFKKNESFEVEDKLTFNDEDLSYVQLKYKKQRDNKGNDFSSVVNIVGDRINLLSHDSPLKYRLNDKKELIDDEEMLKILDTGHPIVYGDELITFLKELINVIKTHTHPFPGDPPCFTAPQIKTLNTDLDKMLSKSVRSN